MVLDGENILSASEIESVRSQVFRYFCSKEKILENLVAQENMKKWISHNIAIARRGNQESVDIEVWPESAQSEFGSSNSSIIGRLQSEGYNVSLNKKKTYMTPLPFIRNVFITVSGL